MAGVGYKYPTQSAPQPVQASTLHQPMTTHYTTAQPMAHVNVQPQQQAYVMPGVAHYQPAPAQPVRTTPMNVAQIEALYR
jgi:hypothetical protein